MKISHAILHVFDLESGTCTFSQRELDLSARTTKSYVQRCLRKIVSSPDSRHGEFSPESQFAAELSAYLTGQRDFVDLSIQVGQFLYEQLRLADEAEQCDLLVADFERDPDVKTPTQIDVTAASEIGDGADFADAVDAAMQAALDAAYEARGERCFALILLPRKQTFMHDVRDEDGMAVSDVVRTNDSLPNPTQKIDSYACVGTDAMTIDFCDHERTIAGAPTCLIPDGLLQCSTQASTREVLQKVNRIVEDVAEEFGRNAAVALSKAKTYVSAHSGDLESFSPEDVGREVFDDEPTLRERYVERARNEDLPERVNVRRSVATRMAKSHRIRTDTGIEVTFPSEYSTNSDFISFVHEPDGSYSIQLRNIGRIENR